MLFVGDVAVENGPQVSKVLPSVPERKKAGIGPTEKNTRVR